MLHWQGCAFRPYRCNHDDLMFTLGRCHRVQWHHIQSKIFPIKENSCNTWYQSDWNSQCIGSRPFELGRGRRRVIPNAGARRGRGNRGRSRSLPPYLCPVGIGLEEDRTDTSFMSASSRRPKFFSFFSLFHNVSTWFNNTKFDQLHLVAEGALVMFPSNGHITKGVVNDATTTITSVYVDNHIVVTNISVQFIGISTQIFLNNFQHKYTYERYYYKASFPILLEL